MTTTAHGLDELKALAGADLGHTGWLEITQDRVNAFADATGDHQWIHVDRERAAAGPFGGTIAHGMLMLSLVPAAQFELGVYPSDAANVLNYGFDKVRFLAPVPAGSRIMVQVELSDVEAKGPGRTLVRCRNTAFVEGASERPVMVAESMCMVMA